MKVIYCEGASYGKERKACSKQLTPQLMVSVENLIVAYLFKRLAVIDGT